jgi:RNA polymerase sigma-70 factor (ECF subfamily)
MLALPALAGLAGLVASRAREKGTPNRLPSGDRLTEPELWLTASTEALMEAYVAGSASAFDELYARIAPKLFGHLLRLTRDRQRAEDLLQVTFVKIHRARSSYLEGAPVLPWASAIARRSFFDEVRKRRVRHEELSFDGQLPEPAQSESAVPMEVGEALERALDALPEAYREAIQLTKVSGLSIQEAAAVLGATPTAVKLRVHRGYVALRKALEGIEGGTT